MADIMNNKDKKRVLRYWS